MYGAAAAVRRVSRPLTARTTPTSTTTPLVATETLKRLASPTISPNTEDKALLSIPAVTQRALREASAAGVSLTIDEKRALTDRCVAVMRYSDVTVISAFGMLCESLRSQKRGADIAAEVLRRSRSRGSYLNAEGFGPFLRLVAEYGERPGVVHTHWVWMQHSRAWFCPIARSAVVQATLAEGRISAAVELEKDMRKDGVCLQEQALVPLVAGLPKAKWTEAMNMVQYWRMEHGHQASSAVSSAAASVSAVTVQKQTQSSVASPPSRRMFGDGAPGTATTAALVACLHRARQSRSVVRVVASDTSELIPEALGPASLSTTLRALLPAAAAAASSLSDTNKSTLPKAAEEGRLAEAAAAALEGLVAASRKVVFTSPSPTSGAVTRPETLELAGTLAAAAAGRKDREELRRIGRRLSDLDVTDAEYSAMHSAMIDALLPTQWKLGKVAVVELANVTQRQVPTEAVSRLMVLHQAVEGDKGAVLDSFLGQDEE